MSTAEGGTLRLRRGAKVRQEKAVVCRTKPDIL